MRAPVIAGPIATTALLLAVAAGAYGQVRDATLFPDILAAKVTPRSAGVFDFDVTVSSPYDTPARYADAFRVMTQDGRVLGERVLLHDHQNEQPFTRDLYGVAIAAGTKTVIIQGRDQKYGWGGKTLDVTLPGR